MDDKKLGWWRMDFMNGHVLHGSDLRKHSNLIFHCTFQIKSEVKIFPHTEIFFEFLRHTSEIALKTVLRTENKVVKLLLRIWNLPADIRQHKYIWISRQMPRLESDIYTFFFELKGREESTAATLDSWPALAGSAAGFYKLIDAKHFYQK